MKSVFAFILSLIVVVTAQEIHGKRRADGDRSSEKTANAAEDAAELIEPDLFLRMALRAYALHDPSPVEVLRGVHQLVTQLAGRSGRDAPGRVLVQTFQPDATPLVYAARHDVSGFMAQELERRREGQRALRVGVRLVERGDDRGRAKVEMALDQVLENLLDNALKYTGEGGTIRVRVATLGSFGKWMVRRDKLVRNPVDRLTRPRRKARVPAVPTWDTVKVLLQHCSLRERAILALMAFGGLRRGEVAALDVGDVAHDFGLRRVMGKGGHEVPVALPAPDAAAACTTAAKNSGVHP